MYGSGAYRPLHHPAPRRRDRRAGARSAMRDAALHDAHEWEGREPAPRSPDDKRSARARLRARLEAPPPRWARALAMAVAAGLLVLGAHAAFSALGPDPTPYPDAPAQYEDLATRAASACGGTACTLSLAHTFPIASGDVLSRMRALDVEVVRVDPEAGRVAFDGEAGASFRVVLDRPGNAEARTAREARRHWLRDQGIVPVDLGGGWSHEPIPFHE